MVVPSVVSCTEMPIIRPSVNSELTSGLPHSLLAAKSKSMCSGCGFSVITENSMLSLSVTVLVSAWLDDLADLEFLEIKPGHRRSSRRLLTG